jgi:hypothetical protein
LRHDGGRLTIIGVFLLAAKSGRFLVGSPDGWVYSRKLPSDPAGP